MYNSLISYISFSLKIHTHPSPSLPPPLLMTLISLFWQNQTVLLMRVVCTDSIFGEIQTKLSTKYYTTDYSKLHISLVPIPPWKNRLGVMKSTGIDFPGHYS